jgi:acyl-CoA thioesterase I
MSRVFFLVLAGLVAVASPSRAQHLAGASEACQAPADFTQPDEPLPNVRAALDGHKPVSVLAVGSGTTVGEVNGPPGASFPYRMIDALRAARPDATFDLTVRGGRNMTAEAMLDLIKTELATKRFALVFWQTGTVEAVRGLRPDALRSVLQEGVEAIQQAGGDVVLIDSQFSRFLRANTDLDPYENVMQQIAALPGVVLFHRFDLMRSWANDGHIDLERVHKADREKAVALLNTCLGEALANFVLDGAEQAGH